VADDKARNKKATDYYHSINILEPVHTEKLGIITNGNPVAEGV
jgi:hypothetical protein